MAYGNHRWGIEMNFAKVLWTLRAGLYSILYRNIQMPSYLGKPIIITKKGNLKIGKKTRIYPGIRCEIVNNDSSVVIGNNVSIGQNFHVVSCNDALIIGNDVTISGNVMITNCDHNYQELGVHILDQKLECKHTEIGNGCFLGYGCVIQAGTVLGKQCVVGANSVVRGVFPDYSVIVGAPAKIKKQYNSEKEVWEKVSL